MDPKVNQALISHTRYLQDSIEGDYSLLNAGTLLEDIDFILVEMEQNQDRPGGEILSFIKDLIQQKRLLFKIHIISKEIKNIKSGV